MRKGPGWPEVAIRCRRRCEHRVRLSPTSAPPGEYRELRSDPLSGLIAALADRDEGGRRPQSGRRHTDVDRLGSADLEGFVPDSYGTGCVAGPLVERSPCWAVRRIPVAGVVVKAIHRIPVLNEPRTTRIKDQSRAEESRLRISRQFAEHCWHCAEHRQPQVGPPRLVDPHTDEKQHQITVVAVRHPIWIN